MVHWNLLIVKVIVLFFSAYKSHVLLFYAEHLHIPLTLFKDAPFKFGVWTKHLFYDIYMFYTPCAWERQFFSDFRRPVLQMTLVIKVSIIIGNMCPIYGLKYSYDSMDGRILGRRFGKMWGQCHNADSYCQGNTVID